MMNFAIEIAKNTRLNFIRLLDTLTIGRLNEIPAGFNNNIAWNFAHIVAAQQTICYLKSNTEPRLKIELIKKYRMGTKPEEFMGQEEIV